VRLAIGISTEEKWTGLYKNRRRIIEFATSDLSFLSYNKEAQPTQPTGETRKRFVFMVFKFNEAL